MSVSVRNPDLPGIAKEDTLSAPIEASKDADSYVRLTSSRDVAQTSQMRNERAFQDGLANEANQTLCGRSWLALNERDAQDRPFAPCQVL